MLEQGELLQKLGLSCIGLFGAYPTVHFAPTNTAVGAHIRVTVSEDFSDKQVQSLIEGIKKAHEGIRE